MKLFQICCWREASSKDACHHEAVEWHHYLVTAPPTGIRQKRAAPPDLAVNTGAMVCDPGALNSVRSSEEILWCSGERWTHGGQWYHRACQSHRCAMDGSAIRDRDRRSHGDEPRVCVGARPCHATEHGLPLEVRDTELGTRCANCLPFKRAGETCRRSRAVNTYASQAMHQSGQALGQFHRVCLDHDPHVIHECDWRDECPAWNLRHPVACTFGRGEEEGEALPDTFSWSLLNCRPRGFVPVGKVLT